MNQSITDLTGLDLCDQRESGRGHLQPAAPCTVIMCHPVVKRKEPGVDGTTDKKLLYKIRDVMPLGWVRLVVFNKTAHSQACCSEAVGQACGCMRACSSVSGELTEI